MTEFKVIVLSGGGTKGNIHLGVLDYFVDQLQNVEYFIGTSIGSMICLLLLIGYKPFEIFMKGYELDAKQMFTFTNAIESLNNLGIMHMDKYIKIIEQMIIDKMGTVPTLQELHEKTGKFFSATVTNLSSQNVEYLSHVTYPNMSCLTAIKMSASIPFIFYSQSYEGAIYVDGSLLNDFPIDAVDLSKFKKEEVLAISLQNSMMAIKSVPNTSPLLDKLSGLIPYVSVILRLKYTTEAEQKCSQWKNRCVLLKIAWGSANESTNLIDVDKTTKMEMFIKGRDFAQKYINDKLD